MGHVFPPSPSGETVDHKHAISPDDDMLRSLSTQPKGFNRREEFGSCQQLIPAMQGAYSSSQRVKRATVGEDPRDTITTTTRAWVFGLSAPAPVCENMTTRDVQ